MQNKNSRCKKANLDNLIKGAAGQAIQNMNLMNDWPIQEGLEFSPIYP